MFTFPSGSSRAYQIPNSLRLNSSSSQLLTRTFGAPTTQNTYTLSLWLKRSKLGAVQSIFGVSTNHSLGFNASDALVLTLAGVAQATSTAVFRDPSAHYHVLYSQSGSTINLAVNNLVVATGSAASSVFNTAVAHQMGASNTSNFTDGYFEEINFIDGQVLTPGSFGQADPITGQWIPKKYAGTYGNNGFYLPFNDGTSTATLGNDRSGNSNNWTLTNFTRAAGVNDCWMTDTPTNNFCTLNPIVASAANITNGALASGTTAVQGTFDAFLMDSYWEVIAGGSAVTAGVINEAGSANTTTVTANKTFGFRTTAAGVLDFINITDAGSWTNITSGLGGKRSPYGTTAAANWNFGQRAFVGTQPTGFKALNTQNLPSPSIKQPNLHFDTKLHTGNSSTQSITSLAFQPDFVWIKSRSAATDHKLTDSVRGVQKGLISDTAGAETTDTNGLTAFLSNGFTLGTDTNYNNNTATYVDWCWKGGGAAQSNTNGSITSQVSANPTDGFSIVTFTDPGSGSYTVGHGLGIVPAMILVKQRNGGVTSWATWHKSYGTPTQGFQALNSAAAVSNSATIWNNTLPTSSVFSGTSGNALNAGQTGVAYCFAEVPGYSKFGTYIGNGSSDGTFVWCGFRPKLVLIKRTDSTSDWFLYDSIRPGFNVIGGTLLADGNVTETTAAEIDLLSNGFKLRVSTTPNVNAASYIFAAFAEFPFNYSNAR